MHVCIRITLRQRDQPSWSRAFEQQFKHTIVHSMTRTDVRVLIRICVPNGLSRRADVQADVAQSLRELQSLPQSGRVKLLSKGRPLFPSTIASTYPFCSAFNVQCYASSIIRFISQPLANAFKRRRDVGD